MKHCQMYILLFQIFTLRNRSWLDNLVTINATDMYDEHLNQQFLSTYRNIVNPSLVYMNIKTKPQKEMKQKNLNADAKSLETTIDQNPNDLYLNGFSEQVFHCLANICNGGGCSSQVAIVENIDKKYNLPYNERNASLLYENQSKRIQSLSMEMADYERKWITLKVFISSTFEVSK